MNRNENSINIKRYSPSDCYYCKFMFSSLHEKTKLQLEKPSIYKCNAGGCGLLAGKCLESACDPWLAQIVAFFDVFGTRLAVRGRPLRAERGLHQSQISSHSADTHGARSARGTLVLCQDFRWVSAAAAAHFKLTLIFNHYYESLFKVTCVCVCVCVCVLDIQSERAPYKLLRRKRSSPQSLGGSIPALTCWSPVDHLCSKWPHGFDRWVAWGNIMFLDIRFQDACLSPCHVLMMMLLPRPPLQGNKRCAVIGGSGFLGRDTWWRSCWTEATLCPCSTSARATSCPGSPSTRETCVTRR